MRLRMALIIVKRSVDLYDSQEKVAVLVTGRKLADSFKIPPELTRAFSSVFPAMASASSSKVKEDKGKMAALIKLQNTNGSFELTEGLCKALGVSFATVKKEMEDKRYDGKAWATALVMEYIDAKLSPAVKAENVKEFDKAKLFLFKVWADSQPFLKKAAMAYFTAGKIPNKGLDGDGRPIV